MSSEPPPPRSLQLPAELFCPIFSQLSNADLNACSLVCSTWTPRAQAFLLSAVKFNVYEACCVLETLEGRNIAQYIFSARVVCSSLSAQTDADAVGVVEIFKICTRLNVVVLEVPVIRCDDISIPSYDDIFYIPPIFASCVRATAPWITHLWLGTWTLAPTAFEDDYRVEKLFTKELPFPHLQALHLGLRCGTTMSTIVSSIAASTQLRVLSLGTHPFQKDLPETMPLIAASCSEVHTILLGDSECITLDLSWLSLFPKVRAVEIARIDAVQRSLDTLPPQIEHVVLKEICYEEWDTPALVALAFPESVKIIELEAHISELQIERSATCVVRAREDLAFHHYQI